MKPFVRNGLLITLGATAASVAISVAAIHALPASGEFPIHWGPSGAPDRWTDRAGAIRFLWTLPVITLVVGLLMAALPSIDPRKGNIETGRRGYVDADGACARSPTKRIRSPARPRRPWI